MVGEVKSRMRLGEVFVKSKILTGTTVERMLTVSTKSKKRLGKVLTEFGLVTEEELACAIAFQFGHEIVEQIAEECPCNHALDLIPAETALKHMMYPLMLSGNNLLVAVNDPSDTEELEKIAALNNLTYTIFVASTLEIRSAISRCYPKARVEEQSKPVLLIVDDDAFLRSMLHSLFSGDFRVIGVENGLKGYQEALINTPQVILTDLEMPGADGYALLELLGQHAETRSIPVVLMTGRNLGNEEAAALEKGFFDFINKPFAIQSISARIKKALQYSGWRV